MHENQNGAAIDTLSAAPTREDLGFFRNLYSVARTTPTSAPLPPVRLTVNTHKGFVLQDYLSPRDAERLAAMLLLAAEDARQGEAA